ncbi:MAG TPA: MFS transporter [Solirubrobacteraceae bacterium]|nr:MFS transporter [Solirubrobacteraceae bacterium]
MEPNDEITRDKRPADHPNGAGAATRRRWSRFSPAMTFVLMVGVMSFFADFTYEGSRSIIGQYLGLLGAGALAISMVTGFGELVGYGLRLFSGRGADRTGLYWPITIGGYVLQMSVVPLLALAGSWQVAALLIILERVGKAIRNPPRDAMLSHAAREIGYGWGFGLHEALDQFGAMCGPLLIALILATSHDDYTTAFAVLAVPAAIMLSLLAVARFSYPRPQDLAAGPAHMTSHGLPRTFWIYLAAAALVAAGFADFPIIAYHFQRSGTVRADLMPVFYAAAMAVSGTGSLVFGRLFDRHGIAVLVPLTVLAAVYAPLAFLGGFWVSLVGVCLWGLGMGVHESIIPAAVAPMVSADRRASAYGLFTGVYGIVWFAGSTAIGALFGVSLAVVVAFALVTEIAAVPLILVVRRHTRALDVSPPPVGQDL